MEAICETNRCVGCGMCVNLCRSNAILMVKSSHGFFYPKIDPMKCVNCGLCRQKCPSNQAKTDETNVLQVYAAWNKKKHDRKTSTSGGLFSALAEPVLKNGGIVVGVRWNSEFCAEHFIAENIEQLKAIRGSKYVQSHTSNIYTEVENRLKNGQKVIFSGTPCQNHALQLFLKNIYENLIQVDVVCHGVTSEDILQKYLKEQIGKSEKKATDIQLRHKNPYWTFSNVTIDYSDGSRYTMPSVDDPYFTLFNIGYSLRESCTKCNYTNTHRYSDITLADYWGYKLDSRKMRDYQNGLSLILLNTRKGCALFEDIKSRLVCSESTLSMAKAGNKALNMPFFLPQDKIGEFWKDYENGMSVKRLCDKYVPNRYQKPKLLWLHQLKNRYRWLKKT